MHGDEPSVHLPQERVGGGDLPVVEVRKRRTVLAGAHARAELLLSGDPGRPRPPRLTRGRAALKGERDRQGQCGDGGDPHCCYGTCFCRITIRCCAIAIASAIFALASPCARMRSMSMESRNRW